jgi:hypothetical protein
VKYQFGQRARLTGQAKWKPSFHFVGSGQATLGSDYPYCHWTNVDGAGVCSKCGFTIANFISSTQPVKQCTKNAVQYMSSLCCGQIERLNALSYAVNHVRNIRDNVGSATRAATSSAVS